MHTVRLLVAYDGTDFHGWQVQPGVRTVQGVLEEALRQVLDDGTIRLAGAGRTDAGVHARGQVASFGTAARCPVRAIPPLANRGLPRDVRVLAAADVTSGFHARRSATARRYAYRILIRPDVLMERFAWNCGRALDAASLNRAIRCLECEADFSAFRGAASGPASPRCRVHRARWNPLRGGARLDIVADHFLYHMVRTIVGTTLDVARRADPEAAMLEILRSRDRSRAGVTAPPHGLCLERVYYADASAS